MACCCMHTCMPPTAAQGLWSSSTMLCRTVSRWEADPDVRVSSVTAAVITAAAVTAATSTAAAAAATSDTADSVASEDEETWDQRRPGNAAAARVVSWLLRLSLNVLPVLLPLSLLQVTSLTQKMSGNPAGSDGPARQEQQLHERCLQQSRCYGT